MTGASTRKRRIASLPLFRTLLGTGVCFCVILPARADPAETVDRIAARAEAVFSGRFAYEYETSFVKVENQRLSFQGNSWAVRSPQHVQVSHDGKLIEYIPRSSVSEKGVVTTSAQIHLPRRIDADRPCPPFFAGAFWYEETKNYIREHRAEAREKVGAEVDGVKVVVLEWEVPASKKYAAFREITEALRQGGTLRVYAAPALGYALPKVEHVGPDGQVESSFVASDFIECSTGIHVPRRLRVDCYPVQYFCEYRISKIENLNEQLSEEDFTVVLPKGSIVADGRSGKGSTLFRVGQTSSPRDLRKLIVDERRSERSPWFWPLVIAGSMASGVVAYLLLRRIPCRRGKSQDG